VFGINECGVLSALARGERFGIIAILTKSIARHQRYLRQMGLAERLVGERPLGLTVAETASDARAFERMEAVGRELVEKDGADVIVMGCAGMARHRRPLETTLGVPVIDPTQAAVAMAIGAVQAQIV
jgi:Asp/Glu/hydantoin racemase